MPPATASRPARPRAGSSAKALLLTVLGEFVLPAGGEVWTSTLVQALGLLGVAERNARQAVARIADDGLLDGRKEGRRARWALTGAGRELLVEGTQRIYGFGAGDEPWDGRWLVVLCPVPEDQRAKRHQLRSRLGFEGFGFLGPGVAVSPHLEREAVAARVLAELELGDTAVVLRAETGGDELLRRAWDLDALAHRYREFLAAADALAPEDDAACFAATVELVHAWRRFPFSDPEIPPQLLGSDWPGAAAKERFDRLHARWSSPAATWFRSVEAAGS